MRAYYYLFIQIWKNLSNPSASAIDRHCIGWYDKSVDIKNERYQRGQVLIIAVFILVVALTVGLSVATRSITTIRTAAEEDNSQKAFSAAEAGIERAMTANPGTSITGSFVDNNSSYSASISLLTGDNILVSNGSFILKDDPVDIWLSDYSTDQSKIYLNPWPASGSQVLTIYWVAPSSNDPNGDCSTNNAENFGPAALDISAITGSKAVPKILHYAFDPCGARAAVNKFSSVLPGATVAGISFLYRTQITFSSANPGLLVRILPLYSGTHIAITGTGLPSQGTVVASVGNYGGANRKIVSYRGYPKAPTELYPYSVFSAK